MTNFESKVKQIPYPQTSVYRKLSDLNNLERLRDRLPSDKIKDFTFNADSVTAQVPMVGVISMRIVERQEPSCVKFESVQSPIPFSLSIDVMPGDDNTSKTKVKIDADIPFMLSSFVSGHLKDGVDKVADMLAQISYD